MVGGTLFLRRVRFEPFACSGRSEVGGVEEVAVAWFSPRFGHKSASSEGSKVQIGGEVIQDFGDDIVWDNWGCMLWNHGGCTLWDNGDRILRDCGDGVLQGNGDGILCGYDGGIS